MEKPQKKTYSDVQSAFESHEILQSSKSDLEQFLLAIAMTRVLDPANQIRTTEMGDTIRLLLAARQSQQMHFQSSKVSCIALIISVATMRKLATTPHEVTRTSPRSFTKSAPTIEI